ncbi:retron Ec48 family effector membrane protein [Halopseudomonas sp.]|uniref:retron Ec48 family effector membrane protein n=1 Tax=Halopseudomonas sp. TaxID=2901191 RepID=UPI0030013361
MNSLSKIVGAYFKDRASLALVLFISASILLLGLSASIIVFVSTYNSESLGGFDVCLTSSCVSYWIEINSSALSILSITGKVLIGFVTAGTIVVALLSYQNSAQSSALANHLSHLNIFMEYVKNETSRRSRLSISEIESLKWYNLIYSNSISGSILVSPAYHDFMNRLNNQVRSSNEKYLNSSHDQKNKYNHNVHQKEVIELLAEIGFYIERAPRIDFNEVEVQLFELINTINISFCRVGAVPTILDRRYH